MNLLHRPVEKHSHQPVEDCSIQAVDAWDFFRMFTHIKRTPYKNGKKIIFAGFSINKTCFQPVSKPVVFKIAEESKYKQTNTYAKRQCERTGVVLGAR